MMVLIGEGETTILIGEEDRTVTWRSIGEDERSRRIEQDRTIEERILDLLHHHHPNGANIDDY